MSFSAVTSPHTKKSVASNGIALRGRSAAPGVWIVIGFAAMLTNSRSDLLMKAHGLRCRRGAFDLHSGRYAGESATVDGQSLAHSRELRVRLRDRQGFLALPQSSLLTPWVDAPNDKRSECTADLQPSYQSVSLVVV